MPQDKKHSVKASLQVLEMTKAGSAIKLEVYNEGTLLGEIEIGYGSFGWKPANKRRVNIKRISWTDFANIMDEHWHSSRRKKR